MQIRTCCLWAIVCWTKTIFMFCSMAYFCAFFNVFSCDVESFGNSVSTLAFLPPGPIMSAPACSICGKRDASELDPYMLTVKLQQWNNRVKQEMQTLLLAINHMVWKTFCLKKQNSHKNKLNSVISATWNCCTEQNGLHGIDGKPLFRCQPNPLQCNNISDTKWWH